MNGAELNERSVYKRPLHAWDSDNDKVLKKPALINPLQEVGNVASPLPQKLSVKPANNEATIVQIKTVQEIVDEDDADKYVCFSHYAQRIVNSWLKNEDKFRCLPNFLDGQSEIKSYMRETLIDWIIDMHLNFKHKRETLYLCVNIIDRYVATTIRARENMVSRSNYQLVGAAAYLIASKYEEICYPDIKNIITFTKNIYVEEEVKQMETSIVNALKYDLSVPTTNKFLGRFLRVQLSQNRSLHFMCYFICDRMLQSIAMLQWKPSVQAAASIYLGRKYLGYDESWNDALEEFTGVKKSVLLPCAVSIHEIIMKSSKLQACVRKYKDVKYESIYNSVPQKVK